MVLLEEFGKMSGHKINIEKRQLMPVGSSKDETRLHYKLAPKNTQTHLVIFILLTTGP